MSWIFFYLAMAVFSFLSTSIGWSISSVLTTIFIKNKETDLEGKMFFNVLLITIITLLVSLGTMHFWINLIFINYLDYYEYSKIIKVQTLLIVAFSISNLNVVFIAMLQKRDKYIKININNMISAFFGFLIVFYFVEKYGILAAAISQLGIQIFLFLLLYFSEEKTNFFINITFDKNSFNLLWKRMKYIVFASSFYRTEELIERFISSYLSNGFLSLVGFVQKAYGALITILNTSIAGPTITKFSYLVKNKEFKKIDNMLKKYLTFLLIINSLIFIGVIIVGEELFMYFFS
jgi:O-antigen/teichoic acid export membrane protein